MYYLCIRISSSSSFLLNTPSYSFYPPPTRFILFLLFPPTPSSFSTPSISLRFPAAFRAQRHMPKICTTIDDMTLASWAANLNIKNVAVAFVDFAPS